MLLTGCNRFPLPPGGGYFFLRGFLRSRILKIMSATKRITSTAILICSYIVIVFPPGFLPVWEVAVRPLRDDSIIGLTHCQYPNQYFFILFSSAISGLILYAFYLLLNNARLMPLAPIQTAGTGGFFAFTGAVRLILYIYIKTIIKLQKTP
jgi:hypothetical protein